MNNFLLKILILNSIFSNVINCDNAKLYLELIKKCLLNTIYEDPDWKGSPFNLELREKGQDWPMFAHTMIGIDGLNNIQFCIEEVLKNNIPGDIIETGVWRGGSVILMRAILKAYNITNKIIWVADSFEGLPFPNCEKYPSDSGLDWIHNFPYLQVSLESVMNNFNKYALLDNQVKFLKGWFKDTLPVVPIEKLALIRLDGDLYESTMDALVNLYPKLSVGGYIIIDDYGALETCKKAVDDFRKINNISESIEKSGWTVSYWKKLNI